MQSTDKPVEQRTQAQTQTQTQTQTQSQTDKRRNKFNRRIQIGCAIALTIFTAVLICAVTTVLINQKSNGPELQRYDWNDFRLPQTVMPQLYEIELLPDFYQLPRPTAIFFNGSVKIALTFTSGGNQVVIHAANMIFSNVQLKHNAADDKAFTLTKDVENRQLEYHTLTFNRNFAPNRPYVLEISFSGNLSTQGFFGMFYRDYEDSDGTISYLVATHLQPNYARRVFPCFDEPRFKARFILRLIRKSSHYAISNTLLSRTDKWALDWKVDTFEVTPIMSTYLLAFVISNMSFQNATDSKGRLFRAFAPADELKSVTYALSITPKILEYFESWLNCSYSMSKLDLVSMPRTRPEAMENWGLIIFQERIIMHDLNANSQEEKIYLEVVAAHELVHQWFGNLVTLKWWDDLWLNEGVATYLAYTGLEALYSSQQELDELFVCMYLHMALRTNENAHSLDRPVLTQTAIYENFSPVHYGKAAALTRMMRHILSPSTFQRALVQYLQVQKWSSVQRGDFLKALTDQWRIERPNDAMNKTNMAKVIQGWISNIGYPVLTVRKQLLSSTNACEIEVSQQRFSLDYDAASDKEPVWDIPFNIATNASSESDQNEQQLAIIWLHDRRTRRACRASESGDNVWIIANVDHFGFYRTNYDVENWQLLISQLLQNHTKFSSITRAQLIDDAFNLARAKLLPSEIPLRMTEYLVKERHYAPWSAAFAQFDYLETFLPIKCNCSIKLQKFLTKLIEPVYVALHSNATSSNSTLSRLLQLEITRRACSLGISSCVAAAGQVYATEKADGHLSADGGGSFLCAPGTWDAWYALYDLLKRMKFPADRITTVKRLIQCSRDSAIIKWFLEAMKTEKFRENVTTAAPENIQQSTGKRTGLAFLKRVFETGSSTLTQSIFNTYLQSSAAREHSTIIFEEAIRTDLKQLEAETAIRLANIDCSLQLAISDIPMELIGLPHHLND